MPLKLVDSDGREVQGLKQVYVYADGKEADFDADRLMAKIPELNEEAKSWRLKHKELVDKYGDLDPVAAREAIQYKAAGGGKKGSEEEVQRLVQEGLKSYQAQVEKERLDSARKLEEKDREIHDHIIGSRFAASPFFVARGEKEPAKTFLNPKVGKAAYGHYFHVEGGRDVAKWPDGTVIQSRTKFGEPADFDEAMEQILAKDPDSPQIMRSTVVDGGGAKGSGKTTLDPNLTLDQKMEAAFK